MPIMRFLNSPAQHSALWVKKEGVPDHKSCNHGPCADEPTMKTKCKNVGKGCFYGIPGFPGIDMNACDIAHWQRWRGRDGKILDVPESPYGISGGMHMCNDDTLLQYYWWMDNRTHRAADVVDTCYDNFFQVARADGPIIKARRKNISNMKTFTFFVD